MSQADDALASLQRAEAAGQVSPPAAANIRRWLIEPPFARYRDRLVVDVTAGNWPVLDDAFYTVLEFGTGGRRGKMYPVGTNVLNERTIAESSPRTRRLRHHAEGRRRPRSCVIARDTRHNSPEFAALRRASSPRRVSRCICSPNLVPPPCSRTLCASMVATPES